MPDLRGRLSPDEMQNISDTINRKATDPEDKCLVCGDLRQSIVDRIYKLEVGYGPFNGGANMPLVSTLCQNCGFARFFHMEAFGLQLPPNIIKEEAADGAVLKIADAPEGGGVEESNG